MKILLSAFVCEPGLGSEEGVGWGTAVSLAQRHHVHVLTRPQHRPGIERHLELYPCERLSFSYYDFPPALLRCVVTSALWQIYYHAWQSRIASWARATSDVFDPDVVHHITYGRYWTPCSLWKLQRPFIWGPLGGGDACPSAFFSCLSFRERMEARARSAVQWLARLDPNLRATARHAAIAIGSTPATERCLTALGCARVEPLLQMAIGRELLASEPARSAPRGIVFCSVGRLLGWKGQALTLRAFARAKIEGATLVIIGDGPAKGRLLTLAKELEIDSSVTFIGGISRTDTLQWIARSTALIHASFHDQAPTVVFEAMAASVPVIALALGGPARQIDRESGFLIPALTARQAETDMASAMRRLAFEPSLREQMGAAGRLRVRSNFTWEKKAEQFCELYREAIDASYTRVGNKTASSIAPSFHRPSPQPELRWAQRF